MGKEVADIGIEAMKDMEKRIKFVDWFCLIDIIIDIKYLIYFFYIQNKIIL